MKYPKKALDQVRHMLALHDKGLSHKKAGEHAEFAKTATKWHQTFSDIRQAYTMDDIFNMQDIIKREV